MKGQVAEQRGWEVSSSYKIPYLCFILSKNKKAFDLSKSCK